MVASHLGSQAEVFQLFLDAGLTSGEAPGGGAFPPIWDRWNALPSARQVSGSLTANEQLVTLLERLDSAEREGFRLSLFGAEQDLVGLVGLRLAGTYRPHLGRGGCVGPNRHNLSRRRGIAR